MENTILTAPEQCHLWSKEQFTPEDLKDNFETVEFISEDIHDIRKVLNCKHCKHLYFYEFHDEIDWVNGHDPLYTTYIPVKTEEEIQKLKETDYFSILKFYPRIVCDWLGNGTETVKWQGKE